MSGPGWAVHRGRNLARHLGRFTIRDTEGVPVIPIFPLGTVLLPGSPLPLQIFEPRYVALLADLREREPAERVFGVVAIRRGHEVGEGRAGELYEVGCTALVEAAQTVRSEGRPPVFRVATVGLAPFRLLGLVDAGRPYPTGEVEPLEDEEDPSPAEVRRLAERLVTTFARYRRAVGAPETHVSGPVERLATQVVDAMPVGIADRQRVLEARSTTARLSAAVAIVQREAGILQTFRAVPVPRGEINPN